MHHNLNLFYMKLGDVIKLNESLSSHDSFRNFKSGVVVYVTEKTDGRGFGFYLPETGEECLEAGSPKHEIIGVLDKFSIKETPYYKECIFDSKTVKVINVMVGSRVKHKNTDIEGIIQTERNLEGFIGVKFDTQTVELLCKPDDLIVIK